MYLSCSCLPCLVPMNYGVAMRPYTHGELRESTRAQSDAVAGAGQAFTKVMMQECCMPDCAVRCFERRLDPLVGLQMRASEIVEIVFSCSACLPSCWQVDVGIARLPADGSPLCDVVGGCSTGIRGSGLCLGLSRVMPDSIALLLCHHTEDINESVCGTDVLHCCVRLCVLLVLAISTLMVTLRGPVWWQKVMRTDTIHEPDQFNFQVDSVYTSHDKRHIDIRICTSCSSGDTCTCIEHSSFRVSVLAPYVPLPV